MKDNNKIVMLPRDLLHPHPDNPRKDLGDLTELKESIREHGIMQNLTVVPDDEDGYQILIGHRRFAASEGILNDLPCVVAKGLSDREQVGIMLCENMQRSDLTYIEQAHGFQMMLDLGDTVETISEKTGFSKKTIKHRLEIAKLDPEAVKEAEKKLFQLSIADYMELEKVDDIDMRNELIRSCDDSQDLKGEVEAYLEEVLVKKNYEYYKKFFIDAGFIEENKNQWFYYQPEFHYTDTDLDRIRLDTKELIPEEKLKALIDKIKGVKTEIHFGCSYNTLMVRKYRKPKVSKSEEEKEKAHKEKEAKKKKNKAALKEVRSRICDAYIKFILQSDYEFEDHYNKADDLREVDVLYDLLDIARQINATFYNINKKVVYAYDVCSYEGYGNKIKDVFDDYEDWNNLFKIIGCIWYTLASSYMSFEDYNIEPKEDVLQAHRDFIDVLKKLGFREDESWKEVLDGTSELYTRKETSHDT